MQIKNKTSFLIFTGRWLYFKLCGNTIITEEKTVTPYYIRKENPQIVGTHNVICSSYRTIRPTIEWDTIHTPMGRVLKLRYTFYGVRDILGRPNISSPAFVVSHYLTNNPRFVPIASELFRVVMEYSTTIRDN